VDEEFFARWLHATRRMRRGERSRLLRQLLRVVVEELESGRPVRLAEVKLRRHAV
jgi:hypothetical protein